MLMIGFIEGIISLFIFKITKNPFMALSAGTLVTTSRFLFYQITNAVGLMESVALLFLVLFSIFFYFSMQDIDTNFYKVLALLTLTILIFTHERYQTLLLPILLILALTKNRIWKVSLIYFFPFLS